ncbi:hypothetical protein BDW22DRAFT_1362528 [Trametopsis cervina]|nr:hypothetical protein BDW22DRAFT_1362528 [Trametopsis cervina]
MNESRECIPQVSLNYFYANLLPPLPANLTVREVVDELQRNGYIERRIENGVTASRWAAFPIDPAGSTSLENTTFAPLDDIAAAVAQTASKITDESQTVELHFSPHIVPRSTKGLNTVIPDEYAEDINDVSTFRFCFLCGPRTSMLSRDTE